MKKGTTIGIVILITLIITGVTIQENFKIDEEMAKAPYIMFGSLGLTGNIGAQFVEGATNIVTDFFENINELNDKIEDSPLRDMKNRVFAIKWLNKYTEEARTMTKEEFLKFIEKEWEEQKWYKRFWLSISTPFTQTAGGFWNAQQSAK